MTPWFLAVSDCPGLLDGWVCPVLVGYDGEVLEHGVTVSTGAPPTHTGNGRWHKLVGAFIGLFNEDRLYVDARRPEVHALISAWIVRVALTPAERKRLDKTTFAPALHLGPVSPGAWGLAQAHGRIRTWESKPSGWPDRAHVPGLPTAWMDQTPEHRQQLDAAARVLIAQHEGRAVRARLDQNP